MHERSATAEVLDAGSTQEGREPIFVVGVSRSGTTLLAAMLNAHSRIFCGPETFFFPRLARTNAAEILTDRSWPDRAAAFMTSIRLGGSNVRIHELFGHDPDRIRVELSALPATIPSLLEALVGSRARAEGKSRWAEKTPNHLLFARDIRKYYPRAPIIRIVRDPRDVALSLTKVPFGSRSKLANLYLWLERDERSWRFFESDPHSLTVKYEQLVSDPRGTLTNICRFVGERFEERMLHTADASRLAAPIEWWKKRTSRPLDGSRAGRWRAHYSKDEETAARVICHEALVRYGYPSAANRPSTLLLHPLTREFVEQHEDVLIRLARAGVRCEPWTWRRAGLSQSEDSTPCVFWGTHDLRWQLGASLRRRVANISDLVWFLVRQRLAGRRPVWVRQPSGLKAESGMAKHGCDLLLRIAARPLSADALINEAGR